MVGRPNCSLPTAKVSYNHQPPGPIARRVVEDRSPQVVGDDDAAEARARLRNRLTRLEVELDQLDVRVVAQIGDAGMSWSTATTDTRSRNQRAWRPPPHATSSTVPPVATAGPKRVIHGDGFTVRPARRPVPAPQRLDDDVGQEQDHRQPRQVVDPLEMAGPVEVGRVVVPVLLHHDVPGRRRQGQRRPERDQEPQPWTQVTNATNAAATRPTHQLANTAPITPTPMAPPTTTSARLDRPWPRGGWPARPRRPTRRRVSSSGAGRPRRRRTRGTGTPAARRPTPPARSTPSAVASSATSPRTHPTSGARAIRWRTR